MHLPYLFGYKTGFPLSRLTTNNKISPMKCCCNRLLPFPNNPKDLDASFKMDLDFWDCLGSKKKSPSYNRRNTVHKIYMMLDLIFQSSTVQQLLYPKFFCSICILNLYINCFQ